MYLIALTEDREPVWCTTIDSLIEAEELCKEITMSIIELGLVSGMKYQVEIAEIEEPVSVKDALAEAREFLSKQVIKGPFENLTCAEFEKLTDDEFLRILHESEETE